MIIIDPSSKINLSKTIIWLGPLFLWREMVHLHPWAGGACPHLDRLAWNNPEQEP